MDLETVAGELYVLKPEDFTAARDACASEARKAGDRTLAGEISKLRRPSLSAWASNLLVREQPEETDALLRLGEGLRQAHRDLDGAQLRELSRQQHALINALSRQARQLASQAGHPVGEGVQREVETILHAVLADPDAAREWAGGRLVKAFDQVAGFPAAADGARQRPREAAPARPARDRSRAEEEQRRRLEEARQQAEDAERDLAARQEEAAAADRQAQDTQARTDELEQRLAELADEIKRLESELHQAESAARKAREQARDADRQLREARRPAETAAAQVERVSGPERGSTQDKKRKVR
ncbi:hypothetical protein [Streptomyces sp. NPDC001604]|uniref:hypothetical protein n=1 Tax=Streptomyces sp. NPDC001604 TaxID=3364593 RepID=UPI00368B8340